MATTNYSTELKVALALARDAGAEVVRIRDGGALGIEMKPGDEPVTIADRKASDMIVAGLRFDTSGLSSAGSRWQTAKRSISGYVVRHPTGL